MSHGETLRRDRNLIGRDVSGALSRGNLRVQYLEDNQLYINFIMTAREFL
jgi:hypothetical protein